MMVFLRSTCITTLFISLGLVLSGNAFAVGVADHSSDVFVFQKKLAAKGNVNALYKLGYMYEMGEGIELNMDAAKKSYQSAAEKGYIPAEQRLRYLEIKQRGYDKEKDSDWLKSVKEQSKGVSGESLEALFLLGQLYREGLAVSKDLQKSLEIMYQLSMEGVIAADLETEKIEAEVAANKSKKALANKKQADKKRIERAWAKKQAIKAEQAEKLRLEAEKASASAANAPAPVASQPEAVPVSPVAAEQQTSVAVKETAVVVELTEAEKKEIKRKRYEAIMKKLAEEQAEIDRLQGGEVDDEF